MIKFAYDTATTPAIRRRRQRKHKVCGDEGPPKVQNRFEPMVADVTNRKRRERAVKDRRC